MSNPSLDFLRVRTRIEGLFPFFLHPKDIDNAVLENLPAHAGDTRDKGSIPGVEKIPWRRQWQPTPVFLPGNSHGQKSPAGYNPCVAESHSTEHTHIKSTDCFFILIFFFTATKIEGKKIEKRTEGRGKCP